jgi:hypothetical protein
MRNNLGRLDVLLEEQQELIIIRNKQEIARVVPMTKKTPQPCPAKASPRKNPTVFGGLNPSRP